MGSFRPMYLRAIASSDAVGRFPTVQYSGDLFRSFRSWRPRPIASDVASDGAFFDRFTRGRSPHPFQVVDFRPKYLRPIFSGFAAPGVGICLPTYNRAWAKT